MTIYEGNTITINGEEIAINQAETKDLLQYLDDAPSWDMPEIEPVAKELCDRMDVTFDAYDGYEELFDALTAINDGKGPVEYRLCCGDHECDRDEAYEFDVADYRDHEVNVHEVFYSKDEALAALAKYDCTIHDYGRYYMVRMWYIESHDLRDDYYDIEAVAEEGRRD